jgi:NADH-quinone oxidoreductase subunit L
MDHDDHGHGHGHDHHEPHESPWVVTVPLVLLAIPSVVIGFMTLSPCCLATSSRTPSSSMRPARTRPWPSWPRRSTVRLQMAGMRFFTAPFWLALAGVALSYYMYMVNPALPAAIKARVPAHLHAAGEQVLHGLVQRERAGPRCARAGHRPVEGRRPGRDRRCRGQRLLEAGGLGRGIVRWFQSGYLYHYALVMILGVFVLMTYFVWLNK